MVRDYELMYIVRPDLDEEGVAAAVQSVEDLLGAQGGEVLSTQTLGKRRLAYEIDKLRDGHYVVLHLRLDGARVATVERQLGIHETVFRHMLTIHVAERVEPETAPDLAAADVAEMASASAAPKETPSEPAAPASTGPAAAEQTEMEEGADVRGDGDGPVGVGLRDEARSAVEDV